MELITPNLLTATHNLYSFIQPLCKIPTVLLNGEFVTFYSSAYLELTKQTYNITILFRFISVKN